MRTVELVADRSGERLDAFVARRLPELSRSHAHRLISDGLVTVDGRQLKPAERVAAGATVSVTIPLPEPPPGLEPEPIPVTVIFQDFDLMVVDKPAGLT
ncbi:MAG TPA: S4 domain-containing protein, partial [Dehalococcoidia bacterium]|nr:S4 domain-containing protein [Dehalococcoidia bacterium]